MSGIKQKIQNIIQLVPFPAVAMEVVRLVDNPKTSAAKLGEVISQDQALAAKVLKVANSPFYGFPKQISTINFAIVVLGFETLKEIVLSVSLASSLVNKLDKDFDLEKFWKHSLLVGLMTKHLAKDLNYRVSGEAFIAGLLHDVGILVVAQYFKKEFQQIIQIGKRREFTFEQIERRFLDNSTHYEIGSLLAEKWNFPDQLVEAIAFHHQPHLAPKNPQLPSLVYLAEYVCFKLGLENIEYADHDESFSADLPAVLEVLKLDESFLNDGFIEKYRAKIQSDVMKNQIFSGEM
ncbi:HDOD domain-containing protein [Candidatus Chrysopegis kryptomonas]|jgi:HD-like signal output (HDOD) protein|uniref:HD-like signal output (HDOD) domain, no enzymatic activity n=1 Tax=Candidatus Chryseopegocella kryptomonas TaxID=1633643 RepID=A0A0P1MWK3_9BACT|nr:HDOD domain-containing protein [Candidatus Chrysopegis kryptomonas]CUT00351.1 HD-like signal output (HDOD) domain, no enzymatic activity [Candidatus Chrysopegis kryptomonas]